MKKPPLLNDADSVQAKVEMLDDLLDIEVACSLLRGGSDDSSKDPIDVNYEKLKTDIKVVDRDSEEAEVIRKYVKNTHATTHNAYDLEVVDIFKIARRGEPALQALQAAPQPQVAVAWVQDHQLHWDPVPGPADSSARSSCDRLHVRERHLFH